MKKTLLASAIALVFGSAGQALADASNTSSDNSGTLSQTATTTSNSDQNNTKNEAIGAGTAAANNGASAITTLSNAFNTSKALALSKLDGSVTGNSVSNIGNVATNSGDGNGGAGTGGTNGTGGSGNSSAPNAGSFSMSNTNTMTSVGQSAVGIVVANQNSGIASLVQQSINIQANLNVGK